LENGEPDLNPENSEELWKNLFAVLQED